MSWYMRDFPGARFMGGDLSADYQSLDAIMMGDGNANYAATKDKLQAEYTRFDYVQVWWPMQDYYDLTWDRIKNNLTDAKRRNALWEIIFNRNYKPYADLNGNNGLVPENWNPSHRFSLFIRNDVAAQVWDYQVGQVAGAGPRPGDGPPLRLRHARGHRLDRRARAGGGVFGTKNGSRNPADACQEVLLRFWLRRCH